MSEKPRLTEADVAQFLQDHPEFFIGKDDLLAELHIAHNIGGATSLLERQLAVHRQRNVELRQRLSDLLENARRNDQLFAKTRRLILALVEAENWLAIQAALDDVLRKDFAVDHWALVHFTERQLDAPLTVLQGEPQRALLRLFKGRHALCGQFSQAEMAALLGTEQTSARSVAAAQIRGKTNIGILAVGSNDENYYRSSMDTLFLDYVSDVLAMRLDQTPVN